MTQLELSPAAELRRVRGAIGHAVEAFWRQRLDGDCLFHAEDVLRHVRSQGLKIAPASPDRILRDLRNQGRLNYLLVKRGSSSYRALELSEDASAPPPHLERWERRLLALAQSDTAHLEAFLRVARQVSGGAA